MRNPAVWRRWLHSGKWFYLESEERPGVGDWEPLYSAHEPPAPASNERCSHSAWYLKGGVVTCALCEIECLQGLLLAQTKLNTQMFEAGRADALHSTPEPCALPKFGYDKQFTIHRGDAGSSAYRDEYVHWLEAQLKKPTQPPGEDAIDAARYRRLRVLGVAPAESTHLTRGLVMRFTNLDDFVDQDRAVHQSRGEYSTATKGEGQ